MSHAAIEDDLSDVRAAASGDGAAYARIIRRHQSALSRRMARFARSRGDVEELVHQVFVEAYFSLPKFRGDAPFDHWLQRIATRVGYRYWKSQKRLDKVSAPLELAGQVAAAESGELAAKDAAEALAGLLDRLPPRDRLVISLLYVDGHSVDEAADLTGWSRTMVKVQAFRARGKLKRLIEAGASEGALK